MASNLRSKLSVQFESLINNDNCRDRTLEDLLVVLKFEDGHIHRRLPKNRTNLNEMIENVITEEKVESLPIASIDPNKTVEQRPIIFKNRQAIGDILMMTCAIRDFKAAFPNWPINVSTTAMHIWDNNPYLDRNLNSNNSEIVNIGPSKLTNASNRDDRHFVNAFRLSIQDALNVRIPQGPTKCDIWMTEEEINAPPLVEPPYWIITAGEKGDWTTKTYPFSRWQEFVRQFPKHKFVQIGMLGGRHKHQILQGSNVINFVGKTQGRDDGIRKLFKLFYHAEGSIGMISFQMHLASAFNMPCIVVAGAREPARFTRYPGHRYLATDGCLPCAQTNACWSCDIDKSCKNVIINEQGEKFPLCVGLITADDICKAFQKYYDGGRLKLDVPRQPTLSNPAAPVTFEAHRDINLDSIVDLPKQFGFDKWGGSSITDKDWLFIKDTIERYKIKSVLEFGSGLSTCLIGTLVNDIVSYESAPNWYNRFKGRFPKLNLNLWNGRTNTNVDMTRKYDLGFVDGPAGGANREMSTKIASELCRFVIVHDAGREWETKWQNKHLKGRFEHVKNGGHRCRLWIRKEIFVEEERKKKIARSNRPLLKMIFNGRGEGGAETSTTWIMNEFIRQGWDVQYITPNTPSATFNKFGSPDVRITTNLNEIKQSCDILCIYCNDYVWEFPKLTPYFGGQLKAKRKVMCVNFRLGQIGQLDWTKNFDQYIFLNSSLKNQFKQRCSSSKTSVLPPPIDLRPYLSNPIPKPEKSLKLIRHSSQGDIKYPKDFEQKVRQIIDKFPGTTIRLMPAPTFLPTTIPGVICHRRNEPPIPKYLRLGNVFFYNLPDGYHDQGPKVIMEAMASGLPVIADNHSGPKDRLGNETGFLCDSFEHYLNAMEILSDPNVRVEYANNARQYAIDNFNRSKWIDVIKGT